MAAHQAPPSLGFSRQEHWSGLPLLSETCQVASVVSDSSDALDCSLPGFSIHGIFQARVLEWGAIASSANVLYHFLIYLSTIYILGFPGGSMVKNPPPVQETWVQSLGWEYLLEKEMATHSSILPWEIPWKRGLVGYSPWGRKSQIGLSNSTELENS